MRREEALLTSQTVAVLRGDSNVKGTVTFEQQSESSPTVIQWNITGNDANAERGMHIHAFGDNTNGCTSAGPHCAFPSYSESFHLLSRGNLPCLLGKKFPISSGEDGRTKDVSG